MNHLKEHSIKNIFTIILLPILLCQTLSALEPPTLFETEHLYCRPFKQTDFNFFYKLYSDKKVMKFIPLEETTEKKIDETEIKNIFNYFIQHQKTFRYSQWAAFEKGTNEFVGRIGLNNHGKYAPEAGYIIRQKFWNKNYATESLKGIIKWVFSMTNINEIIAIAIKNNEASLRVMEKAGMKYAKHFQEVNLTFVMYNFKRPDTEQKKLLSLSNDEKKQLIEE